MRTPLAERRELSSRKRKAPVEILQDSKDVEDERAPWDGSTEPKDARELEESKDESDECELVDQARDESEEPKEPEPEPKPEAAASADSDGEFTFKKFLKHRWDGDSIRIQVEWEGGQRTWEPETTLHDDAPQTLLKYWDAQGGRPDNPREPGLYEIHAIRKHSRDRKRLFVEWVGYGPASNTWEPRGVVEDAAPEILSDYWGSQPRKRRRAR